MRRATAIVGILSVVLVGFNGLALATCSPFPLWGANSIFPASITLVGHASGSVDALGTFTCDIRDLSNAPIGNVPVFIDFSGCSDILLCENQLDEDMTVVCSGGDKYVSKMTSSGGSVSFTIMGSTTNTGGSAGGGLGCARVYVCSDVSLDGFYLSVVAVADQDGNGLSAADYVLIAQDFFSGTYFGRSDYELDGDLDASDLSAWLEIFWGGGSALGCEDTPSPSGACP